MMARSPDQPGPAAPGLPNVHRVVSIAARLSRRQAALHRVLFVGAIGAGSLLLLLLVARLTPALGLPPGHAAWAWLAGAAAAMAVIAGVIELLRPREALRDAIAVDDRLKLRDRLSSALSLRNDPAPFALAAIGDAERLAADKAIAGKVARAFAIQWPRSWWVAPVLTLAAFVSAWLLPQLDLWSSRSGAGAGEVELAREEAAREIEGVVRAIEEHPQLAEALASELEALAREATLEDRKSPEEIRREALRKLTELSERIDELLKDDQALSLQALQDQLSALSLPSAPELHRFAEALKRGDFSKAREALQSLQKDLESGTLTEEQRQALAEALEAMAQELARSEAQQQALADALRDAGLDPQLANNPDAMREALENHPRLSESQRQALRRAMECQQRAGEMRRQLAQQMSAMAGECKGGRQGEGRMCGEGMGMMLSDLEMKQVMMMQARAAAGACRDGKGGLCQAMGGEGRGNASHGATSSGGIGAGWRPELPTATRTRLEQARGGDPNADVIAREFIEGTPTVGESTAVLRRIEASATGGAEEGGDQDDFRPDLVEVHKHYFGELKRQVEARRAAAEKAAAPPPEPPAPPAPPAPGPSSAP